MHLLYVVHQYLPDFVGGTELYTQSLVQALTARGHTTTVFYRRSREAAGLECWGEAASSVWAAGDGNLTPGRRFTATFYSPIILTSFRQVLDMTSPTLVHIQHLMGLPLGIIDELHERQIPFLITLHDFWWICANAQLFTNYSHQICAGPKAFLNCARCALARAGTTSAWPLIPALAGVLALRAAKLRQVLHQAACLIAPSEFVRRWYCAHGISPERVRVLSHGIASPSQLPPSPDRTPGTLRCVYLGGLSWQKGVHVVVEALRDLPGVELWIGGDETFDPAYSARLRSLAGANTRFLGRLSREEVWRTLAQADLLLAPSLWYETFSLVVREAFAAGIPALVSDVGALAEAVDEGVNGLRLPPGDVLAWRTAVQRLAEDPDSLARLRAGVRSPLTLTEHTDAIESLYAQIC